MPARKQLVALLVAALAALAILPAAASATVYCVDTTPGELADNDAIDPSCETPSETVGTAVAAASASGAEADTILIGPGEYTLSPNPGGSEVYYFSANPANTVVIRGLGEPHLTMGGTEGMQTGIYLTAPAGTAIDDLRLTIPANADVAGDAGIWLGGGAVASGITVDGPEATNAAGVRLYGTSTLVGSTVDLPVSASPTNIGVSSTSGTVAVLDSTIRATTGLNAAGGEATAERSTVEAKVGSSTDTGTMIFRNSLIVLPPVAGAVGVRLANENNGSSAMHGVIEGTTIAGGGANSVGIRVQADSGTESADATVDSTVISGPVYPLQVWADNGREAKLTASYSNYGSNLSLKADKDGSGEVGVIEYLPSEVSDLEPGFVDAAAGNYHLAPGSPLADLGDPAEPPTGELDIDGQPRAAKAVCPGGVGRRDIGADEIVPTCAEAPVEGEAPALEAEGTDPGAQSPPASSPPNTSIRGKRRIVTAKARVRVGFRLAATEEGARFRCKVDRQRFRSCGARFSIFMRPGRHRIVVQAVGSAGADPTPAVKYVKIVHKQPTQ
jgi:hypothetical protein